MRTGKLDTDPIYACLDLGSNSFHLLIAAWRNGRMEILDRCSERVQLGAGVTQSGIISPEAFDRGIECLETFHQHMLGYRIAECRAVGTNALRVAGNAEDFISRVRDLGFDIAVISGEAEAELIYQGVVHSLPDLSSSSELDTNKSRLVIDIGGGSTEIAAGQGSEAQLIHSAQVGSVSWRDLYFQAAPSSERGESDPNSKKKLVRQLDAAVSAARNDFSSLTPSLEEFEWDKALVSSGTAKMLAAVCAGQGLGEDGITLSALACLRPVLLDWASGPGPDLPGLKAERRELLLPGWAILTALMQEFSLPEVEYSQAALREGLLYSMVFRQTHGHSLQAES